MDRPILFSAPMVCAILDGKKTQTRRIVKPQPAYIDSSGRWVWPLPKRAQFKGCCTEVATASREWWEYAPKEACPHGAPGDRLWVRETWGRDQADNGGDRHWNRVVYRADPGAQALDNGTPVPWTPSIHMPRWASRITLEIASVRAERLQEISAADVMAEGTPCYVCGQSMDGRSEADCHCFHHEPTANDYRMLWESINGHGSWDANPWVWVVEFKRVTP